MKGMRIFGFFLFLTWFLNAGVFAQQPSVISETPSARDILQTEILTRVGFFDLLNQLASLSESNIQTLEQSIGLSIPLGIRALIKENISTDKLYKSTSAYFQKNYIEENFQAVLAWLNTPLMRKINALEKTESAKIAADPSLMIQPLNASDKRVQLIKNLDEFSRTSVLTMDIINLDIDMLIIATKLSDYELPQSRWEYIKEQTASDMGPKIKDANIAAGLFIYRNLTDEELSEYAQFYQTDLGRWFSRIINEATIDAFSKAIHSLETTRRPLN